MDYGIVTGLTESPSMTSVSHNTDENEWVVSRPWEPGQCIGIKAVLMPYILETL